MSPSGLDPLPPSLLSSQFSVLQSVKHLSVPNLSLIWNAILPKSSHRTKLPRTPPINLPNNIFFFPSINFILIVLVP